MSPLVGRDAELAALCAELTEGSRLVTLTGPVGVGKSALARAAFEKLAAARTFERLARVELSSSTSAEALIESVAESLGFDPSLDLKGLGDALRDAGQLLLGLDDIDAAWAYAREAVEHWSKSAPELAILITSRRALGLAEERVQLVEPFKAPDAELVGPAAEHFLDCARRVRPGYAPTQDEVPFVLELMRELDGLPLAFEICAPRLAVMGPRALLHRVKSSRSALPRASEGRSAEAGALDAALASAWQALEAWERDALGALGVFVGGFSFESAEAVVDLGAHRDAPPVLDVVTALRARSFVAATELEGGELRLSLLECVRDFACKSTDPSVIERARERHAIHFAALAEAWRERGAEAALALERPNLEAVLESVLHASPVTARRAEPALRVLGALYSNTGEPPPARYFALIEPVITATRESGADPRLTARALIVSGSVRGSAGDAAGALRDLTRGQHIARTVGDARLEGQAQLALAPILVEQGELVSAREHALGAVESFALAHDPGAEAGALVVLAELDASSAPERSALLFERASALCRRLGDRRAEARTELAWAALLVDHGRHAEAGVHLDRAREAEPSPEVELVAALDALDRGDADDRAAELARAAGLASSTRIAALASGLAGVSCLQRGALGEAHAWLASALATPRLRGRERRVLELVSRWLDARVLRGETPSDVDSELAELAARSAWARLARRALDAVAGTGTRPASTRNVLVVGTGGRWFAAPRAPSVSLERRRPLAMILERLAMEASERPGSTLSWAELQAAAWPGERLLPEAGAHRVRVAISSLRKLGLGEVLLTRDGGYLLDPSCPLSRGDELAESVGEHAAPA